MSLAAGLALLSILLLRSILPSGSPITPYYTLSCIPLLSSSLLTPPLLTSPSLFFSLSYSFLSFFFLSIFSSFHAGSVRASANIPRDGDGDSEGLCSYAGATVL